MTSSHHRDHKSSHKDKHRSPVKVKRARVLSSSDEEEGNEKKVSKPEKLNSNDKSKSGVDSNKDEERKATLDNTLKQILEKSKATQLNKDSKIDAKDGVSRPQKVPKESILKDAKDGNSSNSKVTEKDTRLVTKEKFEKDNKTVIADNKKDGPKLELNPNKKIKIESKVIANENLIHKINDVATKTNVVKCIGINEYVSLDPLAKWISKHFNIPLKRGGIRPVEIKISSNTSINTAVKTEIVSPSKSEISQPEIATNGTKTEALLESNGAHPPIDIHYEDVKTLVKRETSNRALISTDDRENEDIASVEWDKVKNLKSDKERRDFAFKQFGNQKPGEPNRCMSFHGYKRQQLSHNDNNLATIRKQNEDNSYEEKRRKLALKVMEGKFMTIFSTENDINNNSLTKKRGGSDLKNPNSKTIRLDYQEEPNMTYDSYEQSMVKILERFKKENLAEKQGTFKMLPPAEKKKYWEYYLSHFKQSMEETKTFLKYYKLSETDDLESLKMTNAELEASRGLEKIFYGFVKQYGANIVVECKDCAAAEGVKRVDHPY